MRAFLPTVRSSRYRVIAAAGFLSLLPAVVPAPATSAPFPVRFTSRISASDLKIDRVSAEIIGDDVRFTVDYSSGTSRSLSFFDPPKGEKLRVIERDALRSGTGRASFTVPAGKLREVGALTMRFSSGDAADANLIFLAISDAVVRPIFGERRPAVAADRVSAEKGGVLKEIPASSDVRWKDVSGVAGLDPEKIAGLNFNEATRWSPALRAVSQEIQQRGMDPGLGVRAQHRAGIDGRGVAVGIIDQNMFLDHPEFKERIARYHDVGCNATRGSMHAPAVASLLVGKNIGTAPGATLYFAAAPSWTKDAKYEADALRWLLAVNATLPADGKIRVVSVSAAPSGEGSPFIRNGDLWDAACAEAEKAGVLVLDCTAHRGIIGAGRCDPTAPDDPTRMLTMYAGRNPLLRQRRILTPMSHRTVAEEYDEGKCSYQYDGIGGLSWAIPYAAGVLAMGWQVNPQLSPERMVELLRQTAHERDGVKFIHPSAFLAAVKATRAALDQR